MSRQFTNSTLLFFAAIAGAATVSIAKETDSIRGARVLPVAVLSPKPASAESERLLQGYYDSVAEWGGIVLPEVRAVPGHANWRYLGLPSNQENDVRPTAYAAMVLGFLAEFNPPRRGASDEHRKQMRSEAVGLLRYLTASHVTGGGACVGGTPWGNQWQSAMWARAAGMAAWQMWPRLDPDLQETCARMIAFEADRFIDTPPKSGERNDTGAEENAWNACLLSLACNMLPNHSHAAAWELAAKRYMYNSLSVAADADAGEPGDDGRPIGKWVSTVNVHRDFTLENHGIVHVGYLALTATELEENALHWVLVGREPPRACQHHVADVFQVLLQCMDWEASPIYFSGNDWKTYHSQASDALLYCGLNLLAHDPRAAMLERTALEQMRTRQQAEKGYYNLRRDLEYGGLCATRAIMCCFAHGAGLASMSPISTEQFDRDATGVKLLESAKTIVHRTPNKFASFSWAQKRMGLTLPRDGSVVWPHFDSYLGLINGENSSSRAAKLTPPKVEVTANSFQVSGTLHRCKDQLEQDFSFISPADDYTVYIERLRSPAGFAMKSRETGVVGFEYALDQNSRRMYGDFDTLEISGSGGRDAVIERTSNWLNIDNQIGYVICREPRVANVMRFHDRAAGEGRVPHLQEWLSLVGDKEPTSKAEQWACIVTFPNQTAEQTKARAKQIQFSIEGDRAECRVEANLHTADFSE